MKYGDLFVLLRDESDVGMTPLRREGASCPVLVEEGKEGVEGVFIKIL